MIGVWQLEISEIEDSTADFGSVLSIHLSHLSTSISVCARVIQYENEPRFIDEIAEDSLKLPSATTRRLMRKLYFAFGRSPDDYGDCGVLIGIDLSAFVDDNYSHVEASLIKQLIGESLKLKDGHDGK